MSRLVLDLEADSFLYQNDDNEMVPCEGVCSAIIVVPRDNHNLNEVPFMPYRLTESSGQTRTYRMSCRTCLEERRQALCPHSLQERAFRTTSCLCELVYAAKIGYQIVVLEEALIYLQEADIFAPFFRLCASMKIRHDTIPDSFQNDKQGYCDQVNEGMGFHHPSDILTPDLLQTNLSAKTSYKQLMNRVRIFLKLFIQNLHTNIHNWALTISGDWKIWTEAPSGRCSLCLR